MASHRPAPRANDSRSQTPLKKGSIRAGSILWLREKVSEDDLRLLKPAGLDSKALNHPVAVIDILEDEPSHIRICIITSCGSQNITESKIDPRYWSRYLPIHPNSTHPPLYAEPLRLKNDAPMRVQSYINTKKTHRVSLVVLEKYHRNHPVSYYCLKPESVERIRAACGLPSFNSHRTNRRDEVVAPIPNVIRGTIQSSSKHYSPEAPTAYIQGGYHLPPSQLATEQQPLLPISAASGSQRPLLPLAATRTPHHPPAQPSIPTRSRLLPYTNHRTNTHYPLPYPPHHQPEPPTPSLSRTLLLTLLTCIILCLGSALLGYGIYLGISSLLRATKANFAAVGRFLAGIGRSIARSWW